MGDVTSCLLRNVNVHDVHIEDWSEDFQRRFSSLASVPPVPKMRAIDTNELDLDSAKTVQYNSPGDEYLEYSSGMA